MIHRLWNFQFFVSFKKLNGLLFTMTMPLWDGNYLLINWLEIRFNIISTVFIVLLSMNFQWERGGIMSLVSALPDLTSVDLSWPLFQPRCIRSLIGFRNFAMDHALQWPATHRKSFLNSPWLISGITCPLKMFFSMELWENWRIWRILNFNLESVAI